MYSSIISLSVNRLRLSCLSGILKSDDVFDVSGLWEEVEGLDVDRLIPIGDDILGVTSLAGG